MSFRDRLQPLKASAPFRWLFAASSVSQVGDWLSYVAVSVVAAHQGQGPLALALVFVAHLLPHAVLAPLSGPVVDRFDRRRLLLVADGVRALITVGMAAAALSGEVLVLELLLVARVSVTAFAWPAREAAVARLVDKELLVPAGALLSLSWSVIFAAGVSAGGLLTTWTSPATVILLDGATFLIAGLLHARLPAMKARRSKLGPTSGWGPALSALRTHPELLGAVIAKAPLGLAVGGGWMALNLVTLEGDVEKGAFALGLLHAVRAVGTGVGPWLMPARRLSSLLPTDLASVAAVALVGLLPPGLALAIVVFVWGAGSGRNWVVSTALRQRYSSDELQGRLSALDVLLSTVAQSLAALFGAGLALHFGAAGPSLALAAVAGSMVLFVALRRGGLRRRGGLVPVKLPAGA